MGNLNDLPADILVDILTRLPTEFVLPCKLVRKSWKNLISHHPCFSQMHLSRLQHTDESFLIRGENQQLHYFEYIDDNEKPIDCIKRVNLTPPFTSSYMLLGSFNGLVCLYGLEDYTACPCNPVTKEYVMLPTIKRDFDDDGYIHYLSGFGFLTTTHEYKVVEIYKLKTDLNVLWVAVYTVGSGSGWRSVGRLDTKFTKVNEGVGVYVNEALHWMDKHRGRILVFDLIKEKFSEYLSPPPLSPYSTRYDCTLGDLGVVLYYAIESNFDIEEGPCFDVWLLNEKNNIRDMKEQAGQEPLCWSKEFRLPERRPLAFTKSGGLLCFSCASLGVYNALTASSKKLVDFRLINQIFPHKSTLVSLKELGEEVTKIMGSAEVEHT